MKKTILFLIVVLAFNFSYAQYGCNLESCEAFVKNLVKKHPDFKNSKFKPGFTIDSGGGMLENSETIVVFSATDVKGNRRSGVIWVGADENNQCQLLDYTTLNYMFGNDIPEIMPKHDKEVLESFSKSYILNHEGLNNDSSYYKIDITIDLGSVKVKSNQYVVIFSAFDQYGSRRQGVLLFNKKTLKLEDTSTLQHLYGQPKKEKKNGEWKTYFDNGKLKELGEFKDDYRTGEWKTYFENGQLESIGSYYHFNAGNFEYKVGKWKEYFDNGKLKLIEKYHNKDDSTPEHVGSWPNKRTGEWKEYFINGELKSIKYFSAKSGYETGEWKEYFESGQLKSIKNYREGIQTNIWKTYNENGELIQDNTEKVQSLDIYVGYYGSHMYGKSLGMLISLKNENTLILENQMSIDTENYGKTYELIKIGNHKFKTNDNMIVEFLIASSEMFYGDSEANGAYLTKTK